MKKVVIKVENISKRYTIGAGDYFGGSLKNRIAGLFSRRFRKTQNAEKIEEFYALKDVTFDVAQGDVLGIIGRNGAGKSTLLKILAGVTELTYGKIEITGKVASVLEVGMGFHPELTGRENVYLSGSMLGLTKKEINNKFTDIVEFSGVNKFIDTPIKHYSSGMYVRLAFSVVVNIDADILLFDEVMSVGDISFQLKCMERIQSLVLQKKTILLVSHNINDIASLCNKILYLESGRVKSFGNSSFTKQYIDDSLFSRSLEVIKLNNSDNSINSNVKINQLDSFESFPINDDLELIRMYVKAKDKELDDDIYTHDIIEIGIIYRKLNNIDYFDIGVNINFLNTYLMGVHSLNSEIKIDSITLSGYYVAKIFLPKNLFNETILQIGCSFCKNLKEFIYVNPNMISINIKRDFLLNKSIIEYYNNIPKFIGPFLPHFEWHINLISDEDEKKIVIN